MTGNEFAVWRDDMGYNRTQATEALGLGRNMAQRYEDGESEIPLYIELACRALVQIAGVRKRHTGGKWLLSLRQRLGVSVNEMALRMGMSTKAYQSIEAGEVASGEIHTRVALFAAMMALAERDTDEAVGFPELPWASIDALHKKAVAAGLLH